MKKAKESKRKAKAKPLAAETNAAGDAIRRKQKWLIEALVTAERTGTMRWVLQGGADALRKLDAKAGDDFRSDTARTARDAREAIVNYLYSFFGPLDARTKSELLTLLISDLWHSSRSGSAKDEPDLPRTGEYDECAKMGILAAMRLVTWIYCQLAREGGCLAEELPLYTGNLVKTVNEIAHSQADLVRRTASEQIDWPIMATRHYPKQSDFAKLADQIGLASKSPVKPIKRHTWKPHTPINRYIVEMLVVESYGDGRPLTKESVSYYLDDVLMPLFDKVAAEVGGWEEYPEFAHIARGAAKRGKQGVQRSEIRNRVKRALMALAS